MEQHYHHFEDVEENKFIYTDIFIPHDMWNTLRLEMQPLQHLIQI